MDLAGRTWRVGFPGFSVALMGLVLSACSLGHPRIDLADGTTGTIAFRTQTPTPGDFARRNLDAPAAVIWGELSIPRRASGRVPAVVLVHGSSGVGNNMPGWRSELNGMGVATFIVDSFGGRGIKETATDQSRLATSAMIVDAYRALALLATHPAIDRNRVAVMGFSKGGAVALYSSLTRFQRDWGPPRCRRRLDARRAVSRACGATQTGGRRCEDARVRRRAPWLRRAGVREQSPSISWTRRRARRYPSGRRA